MSHSTVRSVLSRILKGSALTQQARVKVAEADSYIDGALWVLSSEEPTLLEWLHTDAELAQSFKATLTAVYYSIEEGICQSGQLETSVLRTKALMFRLMAATALNSVALERKRAAQDGRSIALYSDGFDGSGRDSQEGRELSRGE